MYEIALFERSPIDGGLRVVARSVDRHLIASVRKQLSEELRPRPTPSEPRPERVSRCGGCE